MSKKAEELYKKYLEAKERRMGLSQRTIELLRRQPDPVKQFFGIGRDGIPNQNMISMSIITGAIAQILDDEAVKDICEWLTQE